MERMWRKVNHSFGSSRTAKTHAHATDTTSSAGGFGDGQVVVAVAGSSSATGRRLATSGQIPTPAAMAVPANPANQSVGQVASDPVAVNTSGPFRKSLSQHVLQPRTASSERRRRRRRKSRPRRSGVSCVGGGGDNMSSSGGFYTIKESNESNHRYHRSTRMMASSAPSGTVLMYPNPSTGRELTNTLGMGTTNSTTAAAGAGQASTAVGNLAATQTTSVTVAAAPDISLRQRAVAKLRMFNFHLNWDLQMTHCKPCGSGSGGNIITRRLCRNRRRDDNELYRSNSFKFERFERKEYLEELADTLQKQVSV
ncbi:hypothetical protein FF38_14493 [Lucilia cuprina]|uniref:Uncharacterized protein n=1 Tax=Lucilia cuprina TaxID=7375 RepID=A0A0L0C996_LUCCU|nr:hypothetical protein CVS40_4492 [Lucilia cuprina]KNC27984.1 hypothetical protein FF38_14493 [Lucilia cuprina]